MARIRRATYLVVLVGISSHMWLQTAASSSLAYCATFNTASTNANYSTFQSNGLCSGFCNGYSYAILQDTACWCSDYTPASSTTTDIDDCDKPCRGYPDDICGGDGLYGYIFMDVTPAGTKDASSLSTTSKATSTERTTTVQNTVSISPSPTSDFLNSSSATGSIATITTGGVVQTVTLAPDGSTVRSSRKGLSTGAAVGIAVGVIVAVLGVSALVLFMWWKKRKEKRAAEAADPSPRSSSAGMVSTMASMGEAGQAGTRRGSKFIPIDDRMEFNATLYNRGDGNPSSDSVNSLRDNMDYSRRVLRATNPDPPAQP